MQYLLDLYSYRKCFILISLKEKKKSFWFLHCWIVPGPGLTWLGPFYLIPPEGKVCLCSDLKFGMKLTMCLNLNFNPAPYVLMPRWRVWFVPVVQRKSLFIRVPVTTFCWLMNKFNTWKFAQYWLNVYSWNRCSDEDLEWNSCVGVEAKRDMKKHFLIFFPLIIHKNISHI